MINSAAFPNEAFSKPPSPTPSRSANCSVACPISPASGMIANAEVMKIHTGLGCRSFRVILTGTNTSKKVKGPISKRPIFIRPALH